MAGGATEAHDGFMAMLQLGLICALPPVKCTNMVADTLKNSAEMGTIPRD